MSSEHYNNLPYTKPENIVRDFASRGIVALPPEHLGIPQETHSQIYEQEKAVHKSRKAVTPASIPDVLKVINAPGLVDACDKIVGKNWAIVPFTHNASFLSGSRDQHWHKDDNGPYNARKQRHHQAIQIEMLYYPQDVSEVMGPTATIPYSQYWTFNHEENNDNFAGADHLDFDYQLSGMEGRPVSGPDSEYNPEDIVNQDTTHDRRMREAVTTTGWPLVQPFEAAPLRAGSILLYSHNTFHRGNHRRDDWRLWENNPRFMWRFWIYRTTEPENLADNDLVELNWRNLGMDSLTNIDLSEAKDDVTIIWRYHHCWMLTGSPPPPKPENKRLTPSTRHEMLTKLEGQINAYNDSAEPLRIGAAYKFASIGDNSLAIKFLEKALYSHRESVRRAATYGLVAVGKDATNVFLKATKSPVKWVRKAGVYGLGEIAPLNKKVINAIVSLLNHDPSVYVRAVAGGTLGCLGRRAVKKGTNLAMISDCIKALIISLDQEENRLSMDLEQKRSIKFVRPTDQCDVCEGNGIDMGIKRFEPVRSSVRENCLWSVVILSSHGANLIGPSLDSLIHTLKNIIEHDKNIICVGFAMDALTRLANYNKPQSNLLPPIHDLRSELLKILGKSPIRCWESLGRSGLTEKHLSKFPESG